MVTPGEVRLLKVFPKKTIESMPSVASKPARLKYSDPPSPKKNWEGVPSSTDPGIVNAAAPGKSVGEIVELASAGAKEKILGVETVGPAAWAKEARKQEPVTRRAVRMVMARILEVGFIVLVRFKGIEGYGYEL